MAISGSLVFGFRMRQGQLFAISLPQVLLEANQFVERNHHVVCYELLQMAARKHRFGRQVYVLQGLTSKGKCHQARNLFVSRGYQTVANPGKLVQGYFFALRRQRPGVRIPSGAPDRYLGASKEIHQERGGSIVGHVLGTRGRSETAHPLPLFDETFVR